MSVGDQFEVLNLVVIQDVVASCVRVFEYRQPELREAAFLFTSRGGRPVASCADTVAICTSIFGGHLNPSHPDVRERPSLLFGSDGGSPARYRGYRSDGKHLG